MKRYTANGKYIKELRENRRRGSLQKEFAPEVRISERYLRKIENGNVRVPIDVLERIAEALNAPWESIVFATDHPRLVPPAPAKQAAAAPPPAPIMGPRFDTAVASMARDESDLFEVAKRSQLLVPLIMTKLTRETESYAEEMLDLLEALTWDRRDPLKPIPGRDELRLRSRLRELLVLLKGNDVWVYVHDHVKRLPESDEIIDDTERCHFQMQAIVAFGPPGEYGEESVHVPIDNGQPWVYYPPSMPNHGC